MIVLGLLVGTTKPKTIIAVNFINKSLGYNRSNKSCDVFSTDIFTSPSKKNTRPRSTSTYHKWINLNWVLTWTQTYRLCSKYLVSSLWDFVTEILEWMSATQNAVWFVGHLWSQRTRGGTWTRTGFWIHCGTYSKSFMYRLLQLQEFTRCTTGCTQV